jgi:hypothetical protein
MSGPGWSFSTDRSIGCVQAGTSLPTSSAMSPATPGSFGSGDVARHRRHPTKQAMVSCKKGRSVELTIWCSPLSTRSASRPEPAAFAPVAAHAMAPTNASTAPASQADRLFRYRPAHSQATGTSNVNQNACIETNALVAGSHPQSPHSPPKWGISTYNSDSEPYKAAGHAIRNSSLLMPGCFSVSELMTFPSL